MDLIYLSTTFDPYTCYKIRHPRAFLLQLLRSIKPLAQSLQLRTVETQKCCVLRAAGQRNLVGEAFVNTDPAPQPHDWGGVSLLWYSPSSRNRALRQPASSLGSREDLRSYSTRKGQECKPTGTDLPLPRGEQVLIAGALAYIRCLHQLPPLPSCPRWPGYSRGCSPPPPRESGFLHGWTPGRQCWTQE